MTAPARIPPASLTKTGTTNSTGRVDDLRIEVPSDPPKRGSVGRAVLLCVAAIAVCGLYVGVPLLLTARWLGGVAVGLLAEGGLTAVVLLAVALVGARILRRTTPDHPGATQRAGARGSRTQPARTIRLDSPQMETA